MTDTEKYSEQIKQALVAIRNLKAQLEVEKNKHNEPIAIVGMAMRLPGGVQNTDDLWRLLIDNIDAIEDIPANRFENDLIYDENGGVGKSILKQGGYLKNIDLFDAPFFDLTRVETESLDPQQRLLLELTQEALENSGINTQTLVDSETGVFVGITSIDYQKKHFRSGDYKLVNPYSYTGSAVCANAGRISYAYGFQGPSISVDTACSSSLVATHLAVQSLRKRESNLAIVGAANLILEPELSICFTALSGLSKDSRCRPFSDNANGFVRSEGAAVIVLKRLTDAERDKDNILAVIKGSAVNQDGKSNGFTAPSVLAQTKLIQSALKDAKLLPKDIDFIEAHGTGTKIGDPIELEALANVFSNDDAKKIHIASIKSNIGHTESVAGLSGLMKIVLSLNHQTLPKNLHSDTLNSLVDWDSLPVKVVQENTKEQLNYAGVSSFGVTGTNAHVIVQTYESKAQNIALRNDIFCLPISAKSEQALIDLAKKYLAFIKDKQYALNDICAMTALRRADFKYRKVFVGIHEEDVVQQLEDFVGMPPIEQTVLFEDDDFVKTIFVFPGQGAQWIGMAKELINNEPVFKQSLLAFNQILNTYASWDLFDVLEHNDEDVLNQLDVVQPILVAIGIALAELWKSKGIQPNGVIGHSLGEVAATYIADIISLEDAVKIICTRSQLMKQTSGRGLMLATDLSLKEAERIVQPIEDKVSISVVNSSNSLVISGDSEIVTQLQDELEHQGRFARIIKVDVASHSVQMAGIDEQLVSALGTLQGKNSSVEFYSTVKAQKIKGTDIDALYWKSNLRQTVQFKATVDQITNQQKCVFIEMSPHPTLLHALQQNFDDLQSKSIALPSFSRDKNSFEEFYKNFAALYETNYTVDWSKIYPEIGNFVMLPNYAWQKERYWFDEQPQVSNAVMHAATEQVKSTNDISLYEVVWKNYTENLSALKQQQILLINEQADLRTALEKENTVNSIPFNSKDFLPNIDVVVLNLLSSQENDTINLEVITSLQQCLSYYSNQAKLPKFIVLSNGAAVLDKDTQLNATAAVVDGIVQSLKNEYVGISFKTIDLAFEYLYEDIETAIALIFSPSNYSAFALRENGIFIQQLQAFKPKLPNQNYFFNKEQTVLIVGGTGGLGLELAKWLSQKGVKNIALISRSGLKDNTQDAIDFMKQNGAAIGVLKADFSDYTQMRQAISAIETSMPKIQTVIHAAAVLADGLFEEISVENCSKIIQSKVAIASNLDVTFQNKLQSKLILFSSAASVLGTQAQAVYSGANYYLDNLAKLRKNHGLDTISVNWGNIAEIGLAAQDVKRGENLKSQGLGLIYPNELPSYFESIFTVDASQIIPLKIDFEKWKNQYANIQNDIFYANCIEQKVIETEEEIMHFINKEDALTQIKTSIKQHISQITKIPISKIKEDSTFKSIGIDSLMALQLKNKIQADYQLNLNVSSVWSYPTVEKYAQFIIDELNLNDTDEVVEINTEIEEVKHQSIEQEVDNLSLEELMKQLNDKL